MKPILFNTEMVQAILDGRKTVTRRVCKIKSKNPITRFIMNNIKPSLNQSKYKVGDTLYVCETWKIQHIFENLCMMINYKAYKHTNLQIEFTYSRFDKFKKFFGKNGWQSPYFMPKEAARIFLKVTDVRVERLQDITANEVIKEGLLPYVHNDDSINTQATITSFLGLWNSTIKKQDFKKYEFKANPFVWVYEFERVEKPNETN